MTKQSKTIMTLAPLCLLALVLQTGCDPETSSCFVGDTKIATPDGDVPIQDLQIGDLVLSFDHTTSKVVEAKVTHTFVHEDKRFRKLSLPNGTELGVTANHPIYDASRGSYVAVSDLGSEQAVKMLTPQKATVDGSIETSRFDSASAWIRGERATVYNISVAGHKNYFAEGLLVHNKSPACDGIGEPCGYLSSAEQLGAQVCSRNIECESSEYASLEQCEDVLTPDLLELSEENLNDARAMLEDCLTMIECEEYTQCVDDSEINWGNEAPELRR